LAHYRASSKASSGSGFEVGGRITDSLDARADLVLVVPTYTFATPVWGGHAQVAMTALARFLGAALGMGAIVFAASSAHAQELEPRSYTNTPVGLNFLIAGYGYAEGTVAFDPSLPIADATFHTNTEMVAYVRSLDVWGNSTKFDVGLPYTSFAGSALLAGQPKQRDVSGLNDLRFRFSMNFYGAPALSTREFANYHQDVIIGASLQVTAPTGQYDDTKLINIGNNRWSFKPQLGFSKGWGSWTVEVAPGVTFYTDNNNFNKGGTFTQDPVYSVQGHIVYGFRSGVWFALDCTYYTGGRAIVNGVRTDTLQTNTRTGLTVAVPVNRNNSVKFNASTGTSSRTGAEFTGIGIAWQYRWGGGF
jgi:hypothetical protein